MPKANLTRLALTLTVAIALVSFAVAQPSAASPASWAGWARCQINVSGQGYTDQQTHTWMMTGGPATVTGAFRVYPATWSVVGGGSLQRSEGNQTLMAQWATTAQNLSVPIAVFVRASDHRMFIQAKHTQVRAQRSINGYQQLTIDGKPKTPGTIASEAFEWLFPLVEVSRPRPNANPVANGSSTPVVNGKVGYMQPAGAQATASCTWQFGQGSDAPAPPPTVTAQAVPTPVTPRTAAPPPSGPPAGGAADCPSAPRNLVASAPTAAPFAGTTYYTFTLTWAAPASGVATSYMEWVGTAPGKDDLGMFNLSADLSFTPSVRAGSYYIRISAINNNCGAGPMSNEVSVVAP